MSNTYQPLDDLNPKNPHSLDDDQSPQYADSPPPFTQTESSTSGQGTSSLQEDLEEGTSQSPTQKNPSPGNPDGRIIFCSILGSLLFAASMIMFFGEGGPTAQIFGILALNISIFLACVAGAIVFDIERIMGERTFMKGVVYGLGFTVLFLAVCMFIKWKMS